MTSTTPHRSVGVGGDTAPIEASSAVALGRRRGRPAAAGVRPAAGRVAGACGVDRAEAAPCPSVARPRTGPPVAWWRSSQWDKGTPAASHGDTPGVDPGPAGPPGRGARR